MTQLSLLEMCGPLQTTEDKQRVKRNERLAERPSIDHRFAVFHLANPHVFTEMLRLAKSRLAAGEKRIGAKALWEELRVSLMRRDLAERGDAVGEPKYKLDNSFTALYARKLIERYPELATVIEVRKRKGER